MNRPAVLTAENVWDRIAVSEAAACWPWVGSRSTNGYGQVFFNGRLHTAHRVAYELVVGPVPDGLVLDHLCRNRVCCNPDHLEPVTSGENSRRSPVWNGNKLHCPSGHPYAGRNLIVRASDGARLCRACQNAESRERKRKRRAERRAAGLTSRGTAPIRPQAARDGGSGCPGTAARAT